MLESPFRYPGSKNKLLEMISVYLDDVVSKNNKFIDVFIGGGSVLLYIAKKFPNIMLYANDKDYQIYCFWKVTASDKVNELLDLMKQKVTTKQFYKLRETKTHDEVESAYKAIFFNRTTFSGISTAGPIGGREQKSKWKVDCRYNYNILKTKILYCNEILSGRITTDNKDFRDYEPLISTNDPIYIDPPYYVKGDMLYPEQMTHDDHYALSIILSKRKNWVLSYDDCKQVRDLYEKNHIINLNTRYCINGKKDSWKQKNELIITN